jgi:hypothetical protein
MDAPVPTTVIVKLSVQVLFDSSVIETLKVITVPAGVVLETVKPS